MAREKTKVISNVTADDAQDASARYAKASNRLEFLAAKMNEKIDKIKAEYQEEVNTLTAEKEEQKKILQVYATEQKTSWGKKKSLELLHTIIGFRTGTPKVIKDKKFTWDAVLELIKKKSVFSSFVRTKEEINKEAILAEKDEKILARLKDECYIEIDQDETFFVEAKKEELEPA